MLDWGLGFCWADVIMDGVSGGWDRVCNWGSNFGEADLLVRSLCVTWKNACFPLVGIELPFVYYKVELWDLICPFLHLNKFLTLEL
jgi:hypothetical protein